MQNVIIDYTNWKGERRKRLIRPVEMYWGQTQYHPEPQWLLKALDLRSETGDWQWGIENQPLVYEERQFAMKDIHSWESPQPDQPAESFAGPPSTG